MGGLFSAPKPVIIPPPQPATSASPAPPAAPRVAEAVRTEARTRAQGGLAGTIATSARGVLTSLPVSRKSLLGE
jgi:hypothetical protein